MYKARFFTRLENATIRCELCPNRCLLGTGQTGPCLSRQNQGGDLYAINYGQTVALNLDPIEKKPLYHYYPGSQILSLGANSCNLHCNFCQNSDISQSKVETQYISPEQVLQYLLQQHLQRVAFTYTEPVTWYEYIWECALLFEKHNISMVMVTNGYINPGPWSELLPYVDALNIDLKSMNPEFYLHTCKGKLQPVLDSISLAAETCHLEITNLLIPGLNDREEELAALVDFIAALNPDIPLHFSRYFPRYQSHQNTTPEHLLLRAYHIAREKLNYVYIGNIKLDKLSDTYCPQCKSNLVNRDNYFVHIDRLDGNRCSVCGHIIYGRFHS